MCVRFVRGYKVNQHSGCWEWQNYCQRNGYGQIKYKNKKMLAHRLSWELHHGKIPVGLCVLHECDNPSCVNPHHLKLGTHDDNAKDMIARNRQARVVGEKNGRSKLSEQQVIKIRSDTRILSVIAKEYGLSISTVSYIKARTLWPHVA